MSSEIRFLKINQLKGILENNRLWRRPHLKINPYMSLNPINLSLRNSWVNQFVLWRKSSFQFCLQIHWVSDIIWCKTIAVQFCCYSSYVWQKQLNHKIANFCQNKQNSTQFAKVMIIFAIKSKIIITWDKFLIYW